MGFLRELALGVGRFMVALMVQYARGRGSVDGRELIGLCFCDGMGREHGSLTDLMHAVRQLKFFIGSHVCACALVAQ